MVLFSLKKRHQSKRKKFFHWFVEHGINSYWDLLFSYRTIRKQTERECFFGNEITFGGVFLFSYSSGKHIQLCETSSIVLALHRIELIFFMVAAGIGLYFGFVIEKVLIRQGCLLSLSSVCTEPKHFLPLTPPHQRLSWSCTRRWEGISTGKTEPNWPKGYSIIFAIRLSILIKAEWKKWGDIWSGDICPFKSALHVMESCCPGDTEHLPAHGKQSINSLFCFVCCEQLLFSLLSSLYCNPSFMTF